MAKTEYKLDGAASWSTGASVAVSGEGVHTLAYRSTDVAGNVETDKTATVRIDGTPPVTADNAPAGWSNGAVTVVLSATDSGGSGVAKTEYKLDGAASWSTGTSVAVSGEGVHTLGYRSTDVAGNVETDKTATVRIDTTAPATGDNAPAGWSTASVTVNLSASDSGGSGLAKTEYRLDGAAGWTTGTSVAISADGVHTLTYRSTDAAGNVEADKTATVRIDTFVPVTSDDAPAGWSNQPVTVTLTASDAGGSGVAATEYALDGAATWTAGASVTVAGEGVHSLRYRSTDVAGNVEPAKTVAVRVDTTAPVSTDDAPAGWTSGSVTVALSASDAGGSGVARTEYSVDGAAGFTTGTTVIVSGEGVHTIAYRSIDAAGNSEADRTATVRIDTTAPVTSDNAPAGWSSTAVTVSLSAADAGGSGVAKTEYRLDGAASFTTGDSVTISLEGVHTLGYRSIDAAGNAEAEKTTTVRIDTTAPVTGDDAAATWSNALVTVTLNASDDAGSGVATTEYKVDGAAVWTTGTSVAVSGEGVHTLAYRSIDAAGNVEADKTATVRIDMTAPVTTDAAPTGWSSSPVLVTLAATDAGGSGLARTEYKLDGSEWSTGNILIVGAPADHSNDGTHTLQYRSIDAAGNTEAEKTTTVRIDTTAPVTNSDEPAGWSNADVTVTLSATDPGGSGVATTEYRLDGAAGFTTGGTVVVSGDGVHVLTYRSIDAVGNTEAEKTSTVRIDTTAPVTTDDAPTGWSSGSVTVALSAIDTGGSGVAKTEYRLDGAADFTTGAAIVVAGEGVHTLTYRSTDAAGNVEAEKNATVRIDMTAPVTVDDASAGWSNGPVTVTLSATDAGGSAVARTEYRLDGAAGFTSGTTVAVSGEGVHTIAYRTIDAAGNTEAEKAATVRIDLSAPVTSDDAPAGWSNTDVSVNLSATDNASGVARTEYKLDGSAVWITGTTVAVSGEGVHALVYRSLDAAGNVEADRTTAIRIDTTAPVTSDDAPAGWSASAVVVTLSATDAGGSGAATTEYKLDGAAAFTAGTTVLIAGEGVHTLAYRSVDVAGNTEAEKTATVRIDATAPVTVDDAPAGWSNGPVTVTLSATDGGSGVARTEYQLDGAGPFTPGTSVTVSGEGSHVLTYRSIDAVGNTEADKTATVRIDATAPVTTDDAPAGWSSTSVVVALSATDVGGSGVASTEYKLDGAAGFTAGANAIVSGEGAHTLVYRSTDAAGNTDADKTATVRIDTTAPVTGDDAPT
ncbi:MAG: large repetitive protein, partial [Gaiellaceae bacterium]|nr:large repetitive protein [Gaiellaceae bacterium]